MSAPQFSELEAAAQQYALLQPAAAAAAEPTSGV